MPNMNAVVLQTLVNEKQIVFKHWTTIQLYDPTNFHGWLKMTVNEKAAISPALAVVFENSLIRSHVELPRQDENYRVEQFRLYM